MRQLYHTTELIGIKDKNITLTKVFQHETYIEVQATLDYTPPKCCHCQGKQIKYYFQKPSKIPFYIALNSKKARTSFVLARA